MTTPRIRKTGGDSIRMGELRVATGEASLRTLLGSCVGLTLIQRAPAIGGLAHILLPEARGREGPPGKYADTAVRELIDQIEAHGGRRSELIAKLAGGANMLSSSANKTIGDVNVDAVRKLLRASRIPIVAEHCGGSAGRRLTLCVKTGNVTIEIVGGKRTEI